jgi:hypothetical protein
MMQPDKNGISLAGEYAVLSQLHSRGLVANLTLGNTKHVDVLVYNPVTERMAKCEVKTNTNSVLRNSAIFGRTLTWMMSEKHESITDPDLYYCFVERDALTHSFRYFILPSADVARYVAAQHCYWLEKSGSQAENNRVRSFRLGIEGETYPIETPLADAYEHRWDFFE